MRSKLVATVACLLVAGSIIGAGPARAATENWSFETSLAASGWTMVVEDGSGLNVDECDSSYAMLTPEEGSCFLSTDQDSPSAYVVYREVPGVGILALRHVDNCSPYSQAYDTFYFDTVTKEIVFEIANFNECGRVFDAGPWSYTPGEDNQKFGIDLLSAAPTNWFGDPDENVIRHLLCPENSSMPGRAGDTGGAWQELTLDLDEGVTCVRGNLTVTLYDNGGDLDPWGGHPMPWEAGGLGRFTECDSFEWPNIDDFWDEDSPFDSDSCSDDHFVAHYYGTLVVPETGNYTFYKSSDDGLAVIVGGDVVIEEWGLHGMDDFEGETIHLNAGTEYSFEAWFYDGCCGAGAILATGFNGGESSPIPPRWFGAASSDPAIEAISPRRLRGSTREFATDLVRWAWLRCTSDGGSGEGRVLPRDCRVTSRGNGRGSELSRRAHVISTGDRRSGFVRVAILKDRTWYWSSTYDVVR